MRNDPLEAAAMQRQKRTILQAPSEPRCRDRKGRRCRKRNDFVDRYMCCNQRANAIEEWIAAGDHDDALAAPGEDRRDCFADWRRPYQCLACRRAGKLEMPRTADDELGGRDEPPRHGRETVETIL